MEFIQNAAGAVVTKVSNLLGRGTGAGAGAGIGNIFVECVSRDSALMACVRTVNKANEKEKEELNSLLNNIFTEALSHGILDRNILLVIRYAPIVFLLPRDPSLSTYVLLCQSLTSDESNIFRTHILWKQTILTEEVSELYSFAFRKILVYPPLLISNPMLDLHQLLIHLYYSIHLKFEKRGIYREKMKFSAKIPKFFQRQQKITENPLPIASTIVQCANLWQLNFGQNDCPDLLNYLIQLCCDWSRSCDSRKLDLQQIIIELLNLDPVKSLIYLSGTSTVFDTGSQTYCNSILDSVESIRSDVLLIGGTVVALTKTSFSANFTHGLIRSLLEATVIRILRHTSNYVHQWPTLHSLLLYLISEGSFASSILRECIVIRLGTREDGKAIDTLSPKIALDFFVEDNLTLLLKFFEKEGGAVLNSEIHIGSLRSCAAILDKYFTLGPSEIHNSSNIHTIFINRTLEPLIAILRAIAVRASKFRKVMTKEFSLSILAVLDMILSAHSYRSNLDGIDHQLIQDAFVEKVLSQAPFVSLLAEASTYLTKYQELTQQLCQTELSTLGDDEQVPALYEGITSALGKQLYQLEIVSVGLHSEISRVSILVERCVSMFSQRLLSRVILYYIREALDLVLQFMGNNPVLVPLHLVELRNRMKLHEFRPEVKLLVAKFETRLSSSIKAISSHSFRRVDFSIFAESDSVSRLIDTAAAFSQPVSRLPDLIQNAKITYENISNDILRLQNVINFLDLKNLTPSSIDHDIRERLTASDTDLILLSEVKDLCEEIEINLELEPRTIQDLKRFSSFSLFSEQFGRGADTNRRLSPDVAIKLINERTSEAVKKLRLLVANADVRINDFTVTTFTGVLAELRGRGKHQQKMESELKDIIEYFTQRDVSRIDRVSVIKRVEDAFELVKFKPVLEIFRRTIHSFCKDSNFFDATSMTLIENLGTNFLVSDSSKILSDLYVALEGLTYWHLRVISALVSQDELAAGRLIQFFRKNVITFDRILQQAKARSSNSQVVYRTLLKLPTIRILLEPFWNPEKQIETLTDLRNHLTPLVKLNQIDGRETVCITCEELENVIENWTECERFFREGADSKQNIIDEVRLYQRTGEFISSLKGHIDAEFPGAMSLYYTTAKGHSATLSPDLLEEAIQWAVLSSETQGVELDENRDASELLSGFVQAYTTGLKVHSRRLQLEDLGHPDYHASASEPCHFAPCRLDEVELVLHELDNLVQDWKQSVSTFCVICPRLSLLSQKCRVQFLLSFRGDQTPQEVERRLFPFVVQCFPNMTNYRNTIQLALHSVLQFSLTDSYESDLHRASQVLAAVQVELRKCHRLTGNNGYEIRYRDLHGYSNLEIYIELVQDTVAQSGHMGIPLMVLWGSEKTSPMAVEDWLAAAQTGLCPTMHVVHVNEMLPRVRDLLLRGLQSIEVKSCINLLFSGQEGLDAFSHFTLDPSPMTPLQSSARKSLFADRDFFVEESIALGVESNEAESDSMRIDTWILAGKSGVGKTWRIQKEIEQITLTEMSQGHQVAQSVFVVHEGFTGAAVVESYHKMVTNMPSSIFLYFDITSFASLDLLGNFLHHMYAYGLLLDEETGQVAALCPSIQYYIFIELPAIFLLGETEEQDDVNWPNETTNRNVRSHPFLQKLPILTLAVRAENYLFQDMNIPYFLIPEAKMVASYWYLFHSNQLDTIPNFAHTPLEYLTDLELSDHLLHFFQTYRLNASKREQTNVIRLLNERIEYLIKLHAATQKEARIIIPADEETFRYFDKFRGRYHGIFQLLVKESLDIGSDGSSTQIFDSHETFVTSIRPLEDEDTDIDPLSLFEILLCSKTCESRLMSIDAEVCQFCCFDDASQTQLTCPRCQERNNFDESKTLVLYDPLKDIYPQAQVFDVSEGCISPEVRALIAPIFGMKNTSKLYETITDMGHILTSESLVRVLYMHERRRLSASVIFEGDTGCGKSETLKLYSRLINSNGMLFVNLKIHLLALCRYLAVVIQAENIANAEENRDFMTATQRVLSLQTNLPSSAIIQIVMEWIELDRGLVERVGLSLCAYLYDILVSFPLYLDGLPTHVKGVFDRFLLWATFNLTELQKFKSQTYEIAKSPLLVAEIIPGFPCPSSNYSGEEIGISVPDIRQSEIPPVFENEMNLRDFLECFVSLTPSQLYWRILASEDLTTDKWRKFIQNILSSGEKITSLSSSAIICIFVDELNTASCLGLICEAFSSHSMDGIPLPDYIFFVGAINPLRKSSKKTALSSLHHLSSNIIGIREEDETVDYLAGVPYIVRQLPPSLRSQTLWYPNLDARAEEAFLEQYIRTHVSVELPHNDQNIFFSTATRMFASAQKLVRDYGIPRVFMSTRNLIRVIDTLIFLLRFAVPTIQHPTGSVGNISNIFLPKQGEALNPSIRYREKLRSALIMSISVVYLFQLPTGDPVHGNLRVDFISKIVKAWSGWRPELTGTDHNLQQAKWHQVVDRSLKDFWSYATIPAGIAQTTSLMENLYVIILCAENRFSVLTTGPPGCGKSLGFALASDNLKGKKSGISVAFQHLKVASTWMNQCSASTTAHEIETLYTKVEEEQRLKDIDENGVHICMVGVDETGLIPEKRQALKVLHDVLDRRSLCSIMMSNTTLDAAMVSRMIQIVQTKANQSDLFQLAWGILVHEDHQPISEEMQEEEREIQKAWQSRVRGLCNAFNTVNQVILENNWFHQRDFVFLCRFLRQLYEKQSSPIPTLFNTKMLLSALRRHMQTLDAKSFPNLARHFLTHCQLPFDHDLSLDPHIIESLQESLKDFLEPGSDPTTAHCRYTLIVDPTDSQVAVDLLETTIPDLHFIPVIVSDFPNDCTPAKRAAVLARVKRAMVKGECLLLINSAPLQSSLYNVINRHYQNIVKEDGSKQPCAHIAIGSVSESVEIHRDFRLIFHIPRSQLHETPMPFLNRLEKYTLSVQDVLNQLCEDVANHPPACLRSLKSFGNIKSFFHAIREGVDHFVQYVGGSSCIYGFTRDTVSSLLFNAISDASQSSEMIFSPRSSAISSLLRRHRYQLNMDSDELPLPEIMDVLEDHVSSRLESIIHALNLQLLETARVDSIFQLRHRLPAMYLREYIENQEHLSVLSLIRSCIFTTTKLRTEVVKAIVFTRTNGTIRQLADHEFARECFGCHTTFHQRYEVLVFPQASEVQSQSSIFPTVSVLILSAFLSSVECECVIVNSLSRETTILIVVADMKICSREQVSFVRHTVDRIIADTLSNHRQDNTIQVFFLIHMTPEQLLMKPPYESLPINNWSSFYVDSFGDVCFEDTDNLTENPLQYSFGESKGGSDDLESSFKPSFLHSASSTLGWMRVAMALSDAPSVDDVRREFGPLCKQSLIQAIQDCSFLQRARQTVDGQKCNLSQFFDLIGVVRSKEAYQRNNKEWIQQLFIDRPYILSTLTDCFATVWGGLLESVVQQACDRICRGETTRGLIDCIRGTYSWLLTDFFREIVRSHIAKNWGLESISQLHSASFSQSQLTQICQNPLSAEENLVALALTMLQSIVHLQAAEHDATIARLAYDSREVNCSLDHPASLPLYHTFMNQVNGLIPLALSLSRRPNAGINDPIASDEFYFRQILSQSSRYFHLALAVKLIEAKVEILTLWQHDFIRVTLGYGIHTSPEIEILRSFIKMKLLLRSNEYSIAYEEESNQKPASVPGSAGNVCLWVVQENFIRSLLYYPSRLLLISREIISDKERRDLALVDNPLDDLMSISITLLWRDLVSPRVTGGCIPWVKCMRDLVNLYSLPAIQNGDDSFRLSRRDKARFCVMSMILKMVSYSALDLDSLNLRVDQRGEVALTLPPLRILLDLEDSLWSSLIVLLNCSEPAAIYECVSWLISSPESFSQSPTLNELIVGLLGIPSPSRKNVNVDFSTIFRKLSLRQRSRLFYPLYMTLKVQVETCVEETLLSQLVSDFNESLVYLPPLIAEITTPFTEENFFRVVSTQADRSRVDFTLEGKIASSFLFRFYSQLRKAAQIENETTSTSVMNTFLTSSIEHSTILSKIRLSISAIHVVDLIVQRIISILEERPNAFSTTNPNEVVELFGGQRAVSALSRAINLSQRQMSTYFLSQLPYASVAAVFLTNRTLLEILDIGWWLHIPTVNEPNVELNETQLREIAHINQLYQIKLVTIRYANACHDYFRQDMELINPTLFSILQAPVDDSNILQVAASSFVKKFADPDFANELSMGVHIPVILEMYVFCRDHFWYRFTEEDARRMTFEEALSSLPWNIQHEGRTIFTQFLKSWEIIRQRCGTFTICSRENQGAAIIPRLTDGNGSNPALLRHLVEFPESEEHESMCARILEQRLLSTIADCLNSPELVNVRCHSLINLHQSIINEQFETESVDRLHRSFTQSLLTGPSASSDLFVDFEYHLNCHTYLRLDNSKPIFPTLSESSGEELIEDVIRRRTEVLWREKQTQAHTEGWLLCPNCRTVNERNLSDVGLADTLRQIMPNAYMCPRCQCGPIDHFACHNLQSHHHEARGRTRINNACPSCGFFSGQISDWSRWDGVLRAGAHSTVSLICGTDPQGRLIPGKGCGQQLHLSHRILDPQVEALIPELRPRDISVPVGSVGLRVPLVPEFILSKGRYEVDWISISRYLMSSFLHSRVCFKSDSQFFSPIKFIIDHKSQEFLPSHTSVNQGPIKKERTLINTGNVFTRLLFSADRLLEIRKSHSKSTLSDFDIDKLLQFLKRQKTEKFERYCEEMLYLCLLASSENLNPTLKTCSDLMGQSTPPSGHWDPMIRKIIGDFSINMVPDLCRIFANHGFEGSNHDSDGSMLTQNQQNVLQEIQTNILIMIDDDPSSMENDIEELKEFASILSDCEELALRSKEKILLKDLPQLKNFTQERIGTFASLILGDLRVSHYGYLRDYIGKLLGFMSYHVLSHAHLSTHRETDENILTDDKSSLQLKIYTPYISKDWMESITRQNQFTNPEFFKSAFEILSEKQNEGIQSGSDYFDYAYQSFELKPEDQINQSISERLNDSALHQNDENTDRIHRFLETLKPVQRRKSSIVFGFVADDFFDRQLEEEGCIRVWSILTQVFNDSYEVKSIADNYGLEAPIDLNYLSDLEIESILSHLKVIPRRLLTIFFHEGMIISRHHDSRLETLWEKIQCSYLTELGVTEIGQLHLLQIDESRNLMLELDRNLSEQLGEIFGWDLDSLPSGPDFSASYTILQASLLSTPTLRDYIINVFEDELSERDLALNLTREELLNVSTFMKPIHSRRFLFSLKLLNDFSPRALTLETCRFAWNEFEVFRSKYSQFAESISLLGLDNPESLLFLDPENINLLLNSLPKIRRKDLKRSLQIE